MHGVWLHFHKVIVFGSAPHTTALLTTWQENFKTETSLLLFKNFFHCFYLKGSWERNEFSSRASVLVALLFTDGETEAQGVP